jgi:hypothetical protein
MWGYGMVLYIPEKVSQDGPLPYFQDDIIGNLFLYFVKS